MKNRKCLVVFSLIFLILASNLTWYNYSNRYKRSLNHEISDAMERIFTYSAATQKWIDQVLEGDRSPYTIANLDRDFHQTLNSLQFIDNTARELTVSDLDLTHYWNGVTNPIPRLYVGETLLEEEQQLTQLKEMSDEFKRINELSIKHRGEAGHGWDKRWQGFAKEFNEYVIKNP